MEDSYIFPMDGSSHTVGESYQCKVILICAICCMVTKKMTIVYCVCLSNSKRVFQNRYHVEEGDTL